MQEGYQSSVSTRGAQTKFKEAAKITETTLYKHTNSHGKNNTKR